MRNELAACVCQAAMLRRVLTACLDHVAAWACRLLATSIVIFFSVQVVGLHCGWRYVSVSVSLECMCSESLQ